MAQRPGNMSELQQLATTLLTDVTHYTLRGNAPAGVSENSRAAIIATAQAIINFVRCDTHLEPMDDCVKIGEMVAKQMFAAFGAFQQIPLEGSVTYAELATSVRCDVRLLSRVSLCTELARGFDSASQLEARHLQRPACSGQRTQQETIITSTDVNQLASRGCYCPLAFYGRTVETGLHTPTDQGSS